MTRPKEYLELEEYHEKMFGPDREKRIEALELEVSRLKSALDAVITALEVKKSKP